MGSLLNKHIPLPITIGIVAGLLLLGWSLLFSPYRPRYFGLGVVYQQALVEYARQHNGRLPDSIRTPDFARLLHLAGDSRAEVDKKLAEFERYWDVAWGTCAADVDATGFIANRGRFILRPGEHEPSLIEYGKELSRNIVAVMKNSATTTSKAE